MADSQQIEFNAGMVEAAKAFALTPEQFAAIRTASHPEWELQRAMVAHLWNTKFTEVRAKLGCVLMPSWIENYIGNAWTDCTADFMDAARDAYARAAAERLAA
jgi:hypothetical protein